MNGRKIIIFVFFIAIVAIAVNVVDYIVESNAKKEMMKRPMQTGSTTNSAGQMPMEMPKEIPQAMREAMAEQGMTAGMTGDMSGSNASGSSMAMMSMSKLFSNPDVPQEFANRAGELMMKMKENPNNVDTLLDLAFLFYEAQDPLGTLNFANRASTIDPINAEAAYFAGVAHAQLNEPKEAVAAFERSLMTKNSAQTRYNLALVYIHALNEVDKGKEELQKSLQAPDINDELKTMIEKELSEI